MKTEFKGTKGMWFIANGDKLRVTNENEEEDICECLCEFDAKLISNTPKLLKSLQSAVNLLKNTTEFEVLDTWKEEVINLQKVIDETLT